MQHEKGQDPYLWTSLKRESLPEMMQEWYDIKKKYPDYLLAWRLGDFYEFFYHPDVEIVSSSLGLTKTFRGVEPNRYPLAGIPHKATQHFKSLIKQGKTVVIVDQLEDPKTAQDEHRIVKRGVTQILSPGTVIEESLLDASNNNYLISILQESKVFGISFIDLSCGDFFCTEIEIQGGALTDLFSLISRFEPVECILHPQLFKNTEFVGQLKEVVTRNLIVKEYAPYAFVYDDAFKRLTNHFNTKNLEAFGISEMKSAIGASGALLTFLSETQKTILPNITTLKRYFKDDIMFLDSNTQKNLEILRNLSDNTSYGSLISILDKTITPMGSRLLKKMILQPLLDPSKINLRLNIVELFKNDNLLRNDIREYLTEIGDMERIITRINYSKTANARDLIYIKKALKILPQIKHTLEGSDSSSIKQMIATIHDYSDVVSLIEAAIKEDAPVTVSEGEIIKDGYDSRVDEMRDILNHGKDWVLKFEEREKQKLGISSGYKIGFNRVLGYFIQITENAMKSIGNLPSTYQQRQTIKGGFRYVTDELKEMEIKILNADETIKDIEYQIFSQVRENVAKRTKDIQEDASLISMLDILCAFGEIANLNNYCRPIITNDKKIKIIKGRHPVVEQINLSEPFIPNDCYMDTNTDQLLVITGPNWSGKSTYLRQIALITIMAQIGSFIPAESAEIGIVDRVFTRIGASDDITRGQSTFMLEMNETAQILYYATDRSLVIIDELGRGTSTTDGKSIAQAVMEYLHDKHIKTLFSTHFHELINIPLERMKNYHFLIKEDSQNQKLIFLRKLVQGGTDKSYGIHVAMMAGVPKAVVDRAFTLVETDYCDDQNKSKAQKITNFTKTKNEKNLESESGNANLTQNSNLQGFSNENNKLNPKSAPKKVQTMLFKPTVSETDMEIIKEIASINIDKLTPIDAMKKLIELKEKLKKI